MNLPDWMPETLWDEWVAYRQEDLKKPASERSQKMTLKRLDRLRATHCPIKLIELAIEREWRGIFAHEEAEHGANEKYSDRKLSAAERVKAKAVARGNNVSSLGFNGTNVRHKMDS